MMICTVVARRICSAPLLSVLLQSLEPFCLTYYRRYYSPSSFVWSIGRSQTGHIPLKITYSIEYVCPSPALSSSRSVHGGQLEVMSQSHSEAVGVKELGLFIIFIMLPIDSYNARIVEIPIGSEPHSTARSQTMSTACRPKGSELPELPDCRDDSLCDEEEGGPISKSRTPSSGAAAMSSAGHESGGADASLNSEKLRPMTTRRTIICGEMHCCGGRQCQPCR